MAEKPKTKTRGAARQKTASPPQFYRPLGRQSGDESKAGNIPLDKPGRKLPLSGNGLAEAPQHGIVHVPKPATTRGKLPKGPKTEVGNRKPPSKQPGYVEPGRKNTVAVTAHVPVELRNGINAAAKHAGMTTQDFLAAVLAAVVADFEAGRPLQIKLPETLNDKERAAVRRAALKLAAALGE